MWRNLLRKQELLKEDQHLEFLQQLIALKYLHCPIIDNGNGAVIFLFLNEKDKIHYAQFIKHNFV